MTETMMLKKEIEKLHKEIIERDHELAILYDHYELYPQAHCCERSRWSNGWHHNDTCSNKVLVF